MPQFLRRLLVSLGVASLVNAGLIGIQALGLSNKSCVPCTIFSSGIKSVSYLGSVCEIKCSATLTNRGTSLLKFQGTSEIRCVPGLVICSRGLL